MTSNGYPATAVVVGIDGSRAAMQAAVWAIDEAVSRDIPLRLVYVIDPHDASGAAADETRLAVARAALADAHRAVDSVGKQLKIETDIRWGRTVSKLLEESRSAVMICVGRIGLNHACHGGPCVSASLVRLALCPVAVIRQSGGLAEPRIGTVVTETDNGTVLRHAFDEARLRRATLRAVATGGFDRSSGRGNGSAQAQLDRRLARWARLYPDVRAEPATVARDARSDQDHLLVTDVHRAQALGHADCSVLAIRCGNL